MPASIKNEDLKLYFKEIKTLLPLNGDPEKRFISDLESSMRDYVRDNPDCDIVDLHDNFGTPSEVVVNYFETIDIKRLVKRIRFAKWVRVTLIIILVLSLLFNIYRGILIHKEYKQAQNQHVTEIETIIEDYGDDQE